MKALRAAPAAAGGVEILAAAATAALGEAWWALWRADPRATPFQSPAWLLPWARHYAQERFAAIAWRERGALAGLLPVFSWQGALLLAGTGPSDYGDALVAGGLDAAAAGHVLLEALAEAADAHGCAEIDLRQLRADSPLLAGATPPGWRDAVEADLACPVLPLDAGAPFAGRSARWRRNLRHAERLLREAGAETGLLPAAEVGGAAAILERLHRRRWTARGEDGVVDALLQRFLHEAIPALHAAGLLRFQRVAHPDGVIAAAFAMRGAGAVHCYLSGFDPDWARASPGMAVLAGAIRDAAREGAREFHLLRGREPYKYGFGAEDRPTFRRRLTKAPRRLANAP